MDEESEGEVMTTYRKDRSNFDIEQYKNRKSLYKLLTILMEQDLTGTEASKVLNRADKLNTFINALTNSNMTAKIKLHFVGLLRKEFYRKDLPMDCIREKLLNNHCVGVIRDAQRMLHKQSKKEEEEQNEKTKLTDPVQNENYIEELIDIEISKGLTLICNKEKRIEYLEYCREKHPKELAHLYKITKDFDFNPKEENNG